MPSRPSLGAGRHIHDGPATRTSPVEVFHHHMIVRANRRVKGSPGAVYRL